MSRLRPKVIKFENYYYDPKFPGSFSGINAFYRGLRLRNILASKKIVTEWIQSQNTYRLHKRRVKKFERNKTIVAGIDHTWQADLIDFKSLTKSNNNFVFILVVIDVFSKYLWMVPIKNKKSSSVIEAFKIIFKSKRKPKFLCCDEGREFFSKESITFLKSLDIKLYNINSEMKAGIVERVIRTIKERLYRYFTFTKKYRYLEQLKNIVKSYNNSYHRSIKNTPNSINKKNEDLTFLNLYGYNKNSDAPFKKSKYHFRVGEKVLISINKSIFQKGYTRNWKEEIFEIHQIILTKEIPCYKIKDSKGEVLGGLFYQQELQKAG